MKLTFEVHGYMITIEETEENTIKVSAMQDDEVVEEFELEGGEDHPGMEEGEENMEEELPEEGEEIEGEAPEADFDEVTEEEGEQTKLESFASFLKKKK
jgi:hypothetical protein